MAFDAHAILTLPFFCTSLSAVLPMSCNTITSAPQLLAHTTGSGLHLPAASLAAYKQ